MKPPTQQDNYLGLAEIAKLAGVGKAAICNRRKRDPNFPAPVAELAQGPVFFYHDVRVYFYQHYRRAYEHMMTLGAAA